MSEMNRKNNGFTTIELAMVMLIFGMIFLAVMAAFAYYNNERVKAHTQEAFSASSAAVLTFQAYTGRYPCPADPSIGRGEIGYGLEERDPLTGNCEEIPDIPKVQNAGVDQYEPDTTGDDDIFIGAVPFNTIITVLNNPDGLPDTGDEDQNTIPIHDKTTYDGWNHKLVYAVSGSLANDRTYNDNNGAIIIVDENNNPLVQIKEDVNNNGDLDPGEDLNEDGILNPGNYAHFTIVSHGENGRGAYASTGEEVESCPDTFPPPTTPVVVTGVNELENCDHDGPTPDGRFLSGLRNDTGPSKNDDMVKFTINETSGHWVYVPGSSDQIHNTNEGNVGFGATAPEQKLDVEGNLRAQEVRAEEYCNSSVNPDCLQPEAIAGELATMRCPQGQAMIGIEQNAVNDPPNNVNLCAEIFSGAIIPRTCPANCRVTGFERTSNGDKRVICRNRTNNNLCP